MSKRFYEIQLDQVVLDYDNKPVPEEIDTQSGKVISHVTLRSAIINALGTWHKKKGADLDKTARYKRFKLGLKIADADANKPMVINGDEKEEIEICFDEFFLSPLIGGRLEQMMENLKEVDDPSKPKMKKP